MTMFSQDQVNQWFAANPNATPQQVAQTVQGLGGLDANQGLAGLIGQHYGTDANTITAGYNSLTVPAATPVAPQSVNDLYSSVLGRAPDAGGAAYWQQQFGDTIDDNELATFRNAAAPELAARPAQLPAQLPAAPVDPLQATVAKWAADNPNATPYQITNAITSAGGLTPELAAAVAKQYGTTVDEINAGYANNNNINNLYKTYLGRDPESQEVVDYWAKQFGSTIEPEEIAAYRKAAEPELKQTGYLSDPFKNEVKDYVSGVLADTSLGDWEKVNKVLEQAQKSGVTQAQLESIYGKDATQPYLDTYKKGITDYIDKTLATDPTKTTFDEVGQIHNAFAKYGLTADEVAKYGGLDPKTAQSYFDQYEQGLGTIMSRLNDPKVDELTRTQTALALASKYGATDAELAKASNGKYTEKDVKEYLDPVRNVPTNLQKLFEDENATAKDIQKFIADAKLDPRAAGIYGAALDKFTNNPELYLRDAANGKADISESYESFLTAAKATPEMATKYADQIKAIEQAKNIIGKHALNKDFGGEYKDYAMQMFLGLDKDTVKQAPKQLDFTERKTDTVTGYGEFGEPYEYEREISPAEPKKGQGVEPIYEGYYDDAGNGPELTGYRKKVDSEAFGGGRNAIYATYDAKGNLTGYESGARVHVSDPAYYQAKWDANGQPKPTTGVNSGGGFFKNMVSDVMGFANDLGPVGTIALMAATGGLGSLAAGSLMSAGLGQVAAQAVGSGLVSGVMSEMGGGEFGKGFVGGAVGSGVGNLTQGVMPTNVTGNTFIDSYLTKAAPNVASNMARTGVMGGDMGEAGLASLLNTGINMGVNAGTNSLLGETGMDKLGAMQPYATGVASNLVSSALTGKDPDLEKALMKTVMQQAMSTGKQAAKTAATK